MRRYLLYILFFFLLFDLMGDFLVAQQSRNTSFIGYYEMVPVIITNPYNKDRQLNIAEERLAHLIYDGLLLRTVEEGDNYNGIVEIKDRYLPNLAEKWEMILEKDRCTYYFMLRSGVKWSDGTSLTISDITDFYQNLKEYLAKQQNDQSADEMLYEKVIPYEELPDYMFSGLISNKEKQRCFGFQFPKGKAIFTSIFSYPIVPAKAFRGDWKEQEPIGTGRYTVKKFMTPGSNTSVWELVKNTKHFLFSNKSNKNNIGKIRIYSFFIEPNIKDLVNNFVKRNQYNLIFHPSSTFRNLLSNIATLNKDYSYYSFDTNNHHALIFNCEKDCFTGEKGVILRRALNTLCGRDQTRDRTIDPRSILWGAHLPENMKKDIFEGSWNETVALNILKEGGYDIVFEDKQKKSIDEKTKKHLSLKLYVVAEEKDILNKISQSIEIPFKRIGIDIEVKQISMKEMLENITKFSEEKNLLPSRDWDLCYWSFATVGLSKFDEIGVKNYGNFRGDKTLSEEMKNIQTLPGLGGYMKAAKKILKYCLENPPTIEMFKIKSELYGDINLKIPDKLISGRINLFSMVHEWYYED